MYPHCCTSFGLLALLASNTFAASNDEDAPNNSTTIPATTPQFSGRTKTVIVTVTITDEVTIMDGSPFATSLPSEAPTYTSAFDIPPPLDSLDPSQEPDHSAPTRTAPMIVCPHPTEPYTISGISIRPSGTTSLVLPSFTYEPLPTSMVSEIAPSGSGTLTLGTSGSPTSVSTTCSHSMSHFVPGKLKPPAEEPPYTSATMSVTATSGNVSVSMTCSHSMSHLVPGKSKISDAPAPTDTSMSALASTVSTSMSTPRTTSAIPTSISSPSLNASTTCLHSMSHIVPNNSAASPLTPNDQKSLGKPWTMLPITMPNKFASSPLPDDSITSTSLDKPWSMLSITLSRPPSSAPTFHPPRPSKEYLKARTFISNSSTATWKTSYIKQAKTRCPEESHAEPRRKTYWSRFFAIAEIVPRKENVCLACNDEGQVTSMSGRRYMWCKDGCLRLERLGCDMVCEEDVIRMKGMYCVK